MVDITATDASILRKQFARLPTELLLEIAAHIGNGSTQDTLGRDSSGTGDARSRQATAYLLALMSTSRQLRSIARPVYWNEVFIASKTQWRRLQLLLKGNRFKKTPALVDSALIEVLDLELDTPDEGAGGIDDDDLIQMRVLSQVKNLRLRVGKDTKLGRVFGKSASSYYILLQSLAKPIQEQPSSITRLSLFNNVSQPLDDLLTLAGHFGQLRSLAIDGVKSPYHPVAPVLPKLETFRLSNAAGLTFDGQSGFAFLQRSPLLTDLCIRDCIMDEDFYCQTLRQHSEALTVLELGLPGLAVCLDRYDLITSQFFGIRSLDTGFYIPLALLEQETRLGDKALNICRNLTEASLGGMFCISPTLFDILSEKNRTPLHTLRLHNAAPIRPERPGDHPEAAREEELMEEKPSGISPQDVLEAFEAGFHVSKLDVRGMGPEWDVVVEQPARQVAAECNSRGISFIC